MFPGLPPPKPIPLKERAALLFVERAQIDVADGAFVAINADGVRTHIPIGGIACLMLEPGARISHAAIALAARAGTLVTWVGEAGVRFYSAGQPGGARSDRLLWQAQLALNPTARLRVVRHTYRLLARRHGVAWKRRKYDPGDWDSTDVANRCLSAATACLYGLSEAAVLAAGYAPAIGFLHTGKPRSFVYDIADLWKLKTVVPEAFRIARRVQKGQLDMPLERAVRLACRDSFRKTGLLKQIIPGIEDVLAAGALPRPEPPSDAIGPAFEEEQSGDDGHRG